MDNNKENLQTTELIEEIIGKHRNTESGIKIRYEDSWGLMLYPSGMDDAMITARTIEDLEDHYFPGIEKAVRGIQGKAVFLGNGLSPIPLIAAERYRQGKTSTPPIIVDVIDYEKINNDLLSVAEDFDKYKLDPYMYPEKHFSQALDSSNRLLSAIKDGSINAYQWELPLGPLPDLYEAELVVNCFGPSAHLQSSMDQQLSLLAKGGTLFTTTGYDTDLNGYTVTQDGYTSKIVNRPDRLKWARDIWRRR